MKTLLIKNNIILNSFSRITKPCRISKQPRRFLSICIFSGLFVVGGCNKFVDIPLPNTLIGDENIFASNQTATAFGLNLYNLMIRNGSFFAGGGNNVGVNTGLASDELKNEFPTSLAAQQFYTNSLLPTTTGVSTMWNSFYAVIYNANIMIEKLPEAAGVTQPVKGQLLGEAYFARAFAHFYLVNLYGAVPLVITTSYETTLNLGRTPPTEIYKQIISDLKMAETLLAEAETLGNYTYVTTERIRINSWASRFLLARVYLYTKDWDNAELYASKVISNTSQFSLLTDLNQVFKPNTKESIWQMKPLSQDLYTWDARIYVLTSTPTSVSLSSNVVSDFEPNDLRKVNWVGTFTNSAGSWNFPNKYKVKTGAANSEYYVIFRLPEMYLVRAEAKAQKNSLSSAISDLDVVRARAGITLVSITNPTITQDNLLKAILHERKTELFTESGHRWLDLNRTGKADEVLSLIKGANWQPTDKLFPIPDAEVRNGNRVQNPGY